MPDRYTPDPTPEPEEEPHEGWARNDQKLRESQDNERESRDTEP
jgi:hypothetical protein